MSPPPSQKQLDSWTNIHRQDLENGGVLYLYQEIVHDWFIEINTPEELFDLDEKYGIALMSLSSSRASEHVDWGDTLHRSICFYKKFPVMPVHSIVPEGN